MPMKIWINNALDINKLLLCALFKSSLILLSTSAGVINHKEALKIGVGGANGKDILS